MNWLDRIIAAASPETALRRAKARAMLSAVQDVRASFDGATRGRRAAGWRVNAGDPNAIAGVASGRLREVARDLCRNNSYAGRAKRLLADNIVGGGIIPTAQTTNSRVRSRLEMLMKEHFDTTACDAAGQTTLYGLQWQAMAAVVEAGEVLILRRLRRIEDRLPLPFALEIVEADQLDTSKDGELANGNFAIQGIEFDRLGRRVAYWILPDHPGATSSYRRRGNESRRWPASEVAHIYRVDRPGQVRGVSWFAPVILKLHDLGDYSDAQLMRQKIAACFSAFITSEEDISLSADGSAPRADTGGTYPVESLEPGLIQRLKTGESVEFANPPSVGEYEGFKRAELREIAVGLSIPYEALSGDLSGVNFSSGRMGWLEFQRMITGAQNHMMIPQLGGRLAAWTISAAAFAYGGAALASVSIGWTPPRREMIQPREEIGAARDAIRSGLSSRALEIRKLGMDPEDLDAEIAADNERADELGLKFDSDPRNRTGTGNAVTAGAPASAAEPAEPQESQD